MKTSAAPVRRTRQLLDHLSKTGPMAGFPVSGPPWRSTFLSHIREMDSPTFVLSTVHAIESKPDAAPSTRYEPRARTVVFRGMWASLPDNGRNPAERNPDVYSTDLPAVTTDVRMEKVGELLSSSETKPSSDQSGVGGHVEAVFWAEKARTQWRFRGKAMVIGPDIDSEAGTTVKGALAPWMRINNQEQTKGWSWSRELTAHFGNLSPVMRGSFKNPLPGTPISQEAEPGLELGQEVEDVYDEIARQNFRVLIIVPDDVDQVDLSDPKRARRWNHKAEVLESGVSWNTVELWP